MSDSEDFTAAPPRVLDLLAGSVTPDQARLSRLVGRGCASALPALGDGAALALQLAPDGEARAADWSDSVRLTGPFGALEMAHGARLLRALTGIDIGAERGAHGGRWEWLQAALIGRLGGTPLAGATQIAFGGVTDAGALSVLRVTLQSGQHAFSTAARGSASAWLGLLGGARWVRQRRPAADFAGLPARLTVRVARHTLPTRVVRTLRAGDIILPDSPNFMCNGEGHIRWGGLTARVRYQAPCALIIIALEGTVEQYEQPQDDGIDMAIVDEYPAQEQDGGATAVDQAPVTLNFELGQARMPFGELRTLGVGAVVLLDGGSPAALAIVAGGRTLGYGEAVEVNGRLAIRVTQWEQGL